MFEPADFDSAFAAGPSASLVNPDGGENTRYPGNYMNWVYFHATDEQRAAIPQVTQILVLKQVLALFVERSSQLDLGLTVFDAANSTGKVIAPCGTDAVTLKAQIDGINPTGTTPLGGTAETILNYFASTGVDAPIQEACEFNFNIIVTDGVAYSDCNVSSYLQDADGDGNDGDCSEYLDDVTWYMANKDLRSDLDGSQNVVSYVVGFLLDDQGLQDAADNGGGLYYSAANALQLSQSIEYAVQDILRRISAGSAVAVVSTERGSDDRLYRGKFMPIDWTGFLECYALPYTDGDAEIWEAGSILSASTTQRTIFTGLGSTRYDFQTSSAMNLRAAMNVATEQEAADLIDWGRGNPVNGLRDRRGWILGDIVHSTPVVVGEPSDFVVEESYELFRAAQASRRRMVYVGANDGMIHGFDAISGDEVWAFVPEFALPAFSVMADSFYCHKYTCDQTPTVKDVLLGGTWRTVLLGGGREGGASIFALDITNPDAPQLMWQTPLDNNKTFHSEIEVGSIGGRPVAIVGSGLDVDTGMAFLYAFDLADGTWYGQNSLSVDTSGRRNKATRPVLIDTNLDGQTDLVYIADYLGSLWRFELGINPDPSTWPKTQLYAGTDPITADPVAAFGPDGDVYVYFGTGAYLADTDLVTTDQQYFFCVFDNHSRGTTNNFDLENQTSTINDVTLSRGWYVSLWNEVGERVTVQAAVVAETVIFSSFAPTPDACRAGGISYLYQMRYYDGGVPDVEGMSAPDDRSISLGEGIASYPVVDLSEGTVVVQSSDASINVSPIASIYQRLTVRSWQESFDHVAAVAPPSVP